MTVITSGIVSHHANWLLATIENASPGPIAVAAPATVTMDGLTGTFTVADNDAVYEITIRPRRYPEGHPNAASPPGPLAGRFPGITVTQENPGGVASTRDQLLADVREAADIYTAAEADSIEESVAGTGFPARFARLDRYMTVSGGWPAR